MAQRAKIDFTQYVTPTSSFSPSNEGPKQEAPPRSDAKPGPYFTQLAPAEEQQFRTWAADPNNNSSDYIEPNPTADYDARGFWKAMQSGDPVAKRSISAADGKLHAPDVWKTPYHRSFSRESKYATQDAPQWNDKDQLLDKTGKVVWDDRDPQHFNEETPKRYKSPAKVIDFSQYVKAASAHPLRPEEMGELAPNTATQAHQTGLRPLQNAPAESRFQFPSETGYVPPSHGETWLPPANGGMSVVADELHRRAAKRQVASDVNPPKHPAYPGEGKSLDLDPGAYALDVAGNATSDLAGATSPRGAATAAALAVAPEVMIPIMAGEGARGVLTPQQAGEDTSDVARRRLNSGAQLLGSVAGMPEAYSRAVPMVDSALETAGNLRNTAAEKVAGPIVRKPPSATANDLKFGRNPARAITREPGLGQHLTDAGRSQALKTRLGELGQAIDQHLSTPEAQATGPIDIESLIDEAHASAIKTPTAKLNPGLQQRIDTLADALKSQFGDLQKQPLEAAQMKREVGQATGWTGQAFDNEANQFLVDVYQKINKQVNEQVPSVAPLNERYADALSAKKAIDRNIAFNSNRPMSVGRGLLGAGGGAAGTIAGEFLGGPAGAAVGAGIDLARTKPVRWALGRTVAEPYQFPSEVQPEAGMPYQELQVNPIGPASPHWNWKRQRQLNTPQAPPNNTEPWNHFDIIPGAGDNGTINYREPMVVNERVTAGPEQSRGTIGGRKLLPAAPPVVEPEINPMQRPISPPNAAGQVEPLGLRTTPNQGIIQPQPAARLAPEQKLLTQGQEQAELNRVTKKVHALTNEIERMQRQGKKVPKAAQKDLNQAIQVLQDLKRQASTMREPDVLPGLEPSGR